MKALPYLAGLLGLLLLLALFGHADAAALLQAWLVAGWMLLWLVPYRAVYFLLYALGWRQLLTASDTARCLPLPYLTWVTSIREAVDRLLPVASVGGGLVGIRCLHRRGVPFEVAGASIIAEIALTLWASYLFALTGLALAADGRRLSGPVSVVPWVMLCLLPVPVIFMELLRRGAFVARLETLFGMVLGAQGFAESARALDRELRSSLARIRPLLLATCLQCAALACVALETWFAFRICGHPVSIKVAVILESAVQAVRHLGFFVPAGLGVQEASLVAVGQLFGVSAESALAVSMAKRLREILCGVPALLSWYWAEFPGARGAKQHQYR